MHPFFWRAEEREVDSRGYSVIIAGEEMEPQLQGNLVGVWRHHSEGAVFQLPPRRHWARYPVLGELTQGEVFNGPEEDDVAEVGDGSRRQADLRNREPARATKHFSAAVSAAFPGRQIINPILVGSRAKGDMQTPHTDWPPEPGHTADQSEVPFVMIAPLETQLFQPVWPGSHKTASGRHAPLISTPAELVVVNVGEAIIMHAHLVHSGTYASKEWCKYWWHESDHPGECRLFAHVTRTGVPLETHTAEPEGRPALYWNMYQMFAAEPEGAIPTPNTGDYLVRRHLFQAVLRQYLKEKGHPHPQFQNWYFH
jgi:hypothetical protein